MGYSRKKTTEGGKGGGEGMGFPGLLKKEHVQILNSSSPEKSIRYLIEGEEENNSNNETTTTTTKK